MAQSKVDVAMVSGVLGSSGIADGSIIEQKNSF